MILHDKALYDAAHAAAWNIGDRHAAAAGRTVWNEDDYDAVVEAFEAIMSGEPPA